MTGRKLDVDKEIKHGFGDYVQVHNDVIDNSTKPRTAGAIALMSSGNLEGSWYYMLLANERIVKRTKATVLPMPDEVILHLNALASKRKTANVKQPVFENSNHTVFNDDDDIDDDTEYIGDIEYDITEESAEAEEIDEIVDNDHRVDDTAYNATYHESQLDMYDEDHPPTLDEYVDDTLYVNDTTSANDELYYDNDTHDDPNKHDPHESTPKYDQSLIDDIFGISDHENEFDDVTVQPDVFTPPDVIENEHELPDIDSPILRRSGRNHQPGKWNKKYLGSVLYNHTGVYKMTVSEGINKVGVVAVDSITSEQKQMCD